MPLTLNELYTQTNHQYHLSMIAGETGIDHIMNWVYVSEDSSAHDFLKGGELIITTGINCQDEASLYDFIETMIKSHTCGMILNTGNNFDRLTSRYVQNSDACKHHCQQYRYDLLCKIFHTSILAFSLLFLSYVKSVCLLCCDISRFINISYI